MSFHMQFILEQVADIGIAAVVSIIVVIIYDIWRDR